MKQKKSSIVLVALCLGLLVGGRVSALTSTVTPAFARFTLSTQNQQDTANIAVTNNNDIPLTYTVEVTDVDVSTGTLLPKNIASEVTKQLFQVQTTSLTIESKKSAVIVVTAKNFDQLSPGGHYAALKIEPTLPAIKTKSSNLQQAFSVPLFAIKEDGAVRDVKAQISFGSLFRIGTLPNAKITLKNTGNVDGAPRGFYSIISGTETQLKVPFNETSMPLFANQEKSFEITALKKPVHFIGKYTAVVSYKIDGQELPTIYTKTGWFVPWWVVGVLIAIFVCVFIFIRFAKLKSKSKKLSAVAVVSTPKKRRSRKGAKYEAEKQKAAKKTVVSDFGSTKGVK